jgi:N-acetylneuraminic acid mutarotase
MKKMLTLAALAAGVSLAMSVTLGAQNPPARGQRWSKAAPFPEPEEELYGTVINGKFYVVGGFGFNPLPPGGTVTLNPPPAGGGNAGRGAVGGNAGRAGGAGAAVNPGPCGGCPPGLVYEYDPGPDKWTKKKDIPVHVHHQAQAAYNGKLYIFGGCLRAITGEGGTTNVWEFDPVADSYRALAPLPVKRCSAIAETVNGKIYVIGGLEPLENGMGTRVTGRNEMYDPATNTWTERSPMPTSRDHAFSGVVNNKIYVIGGRIGAGNIPATTNIDVVEEYDPATNLWGVVKDRMPTPRSGGGAATYNGKIYVGGGELQNRQLAAAFRALEAYDPASNTWEILPSMPSSRHGNAMGFIGNRLHVVSGKQEGGGANDMTGNSPHPYATEAHDVLEVPAGTQ